MIGGLLLIGLLSSCAEAVTLSDFEAKVFAALNAVRTQPKSLLPRLEKVRKKFDGKFLFLSPTLRIATEEGAAPVSEAIRVLAQTKPVASMRLSDALTKAARDHRAAQGPAGKVGHYGESGETPEDRLAKYGRPLGKSGENITYGNYGGTDPEDVLVAIVVDDGVPGRGHRRNLFDPEFKLVGIACGLHAKYERMCVFDMAHAVRNQ